MAWFKWFEGTATDPKFAWCTRHAGQPLAAVITVWALLLERASEADPRGSVDGAPCEAWDVVLGLADGAACAILEAMRVIGLLTEDKRVANWDKRQTARHGKAYGSGRGGVAPAATSTARVQKHRAKIRNAGDGETCNADETLHETHETLHETHETLHETHETDETLHETHETPYKIRVDKKRREDIKTEECAERNALRVSSTPASGTVPDTVINLPLVTGGEHPVTCGEVEQWQDLYPAVDVMQELREMRGWLLGNPRNRKTQAGILRFIQGWLRREQDRTPAAIRASPVISQSGLPTAATEWQYQKQQQRAMAASLLEAREKERSLSPALEASIDRNTEQGAAHA